MKYHIVFTIDGWAVNDENENRVAGPWETNGDRFDAKKDAWGEAKAVCDYLNTREEKDEPL